MVNDRHSVFVRNKQQREMHNYEIITKLTTFRGQPLNSKHSCVANQTMFRMHFKLEWNWHSFVCIELNMRLNCCVTSFDSPKSNVNGQHLRMFRLVLPMPLDASNRWWVTFIFRAVMIVLLLSKRVKKDSLDSHSESKAIFNHFIEINLPIARFLTLQGHGVVWLIIKHTTTTTNLVSIVL